MLLSLAAPSLLLSLPLLLSPSGFLSWPDFFVVASCAEEVEAVPAPLSIGDPASASALLFLSPSPVPDSGFSSVIPADSEGNGSFCPGSVSRCGPGPPPPVPVFPVSATAAPTASVAPGAPVDAPPPTPSNDPSCSAELSSVVESACCVTAWGLDFGSARSPP
ncbi:hypothetical protein D3C77_435390 [compost metagenome]